MTPRISEHSSTGTAMRPATAPSWQGKRVGRFRLIEELGRGAMGRVFRAEDALLHRQVALKVLPKVLLRGSKTIAAERLLGEARAAATLDHPSVVTVYEVNESGGVYYIAMEMLEGGSLRDLVKQAGPMEYTRACVLCADAASGLAQAHAMGIIHRDVKPANLMLTRGGRCKVVDFGLARMDDAADLSCSLPESVGTPQFIAPELLRGVSASARSDIYSLGATLWFLLTGHPPFEAATAADLLSKHLEAPLPALEAIRPDLSPGLVQAISTALAKRPADRFESAAQFEKVLRVYTIPSQPEAAAYLTVIPAGTEPITSQSETASPRRTRTSRAIYLTGAAAGLLVLCAAAVIAVKALRSTDPSRTNAVQNPGGLPTASPNAGRAIDLLEKLNVAAASVKGSWRRQGSDLISDTSGPAILELPIRPPAEYDFRIEFTPQDCVEQLLFAPPATAGVGRAVAFNWCMGVGELCGFESLNGTHVYPAEGSAAGLRDRPLTRHWVLRPGVRHISVVQVRKDGVRATLDGELVIEWKTDYHDLGRLDEWSMRGNDRLGLGTWNKPTVFHKAELIDRSGPGAP